MSVRILHGDVLSFCEHYHGPLFHALLSDPPYHLTANGAAVDWESMPNGRGAPNITKKKHGFMNKTWDGGDVSFRKETWQAFSEVLHPGAFGMAYASSRGWHRMAVAIEDAGFVFHPTIMLYGFAFGSGFPKATRVKSGDEKIDEIFSGHRYGRQAAKPAIEPIIMFQKPYPKKVKVWQSIAETGAGALWIDGARIPHSEPIISMCRNDALNNRSMDGGVKYGGDGIASPSRRGRWPANLILCHAEQCEKVGVKKIKDNPHLGQENPNLTKQYGGGVFGGGSVSPISGYSDENGNETVEEWECVAWCAVRRLGEQSGLRKSKQTTFNGYRSGVYADIDDGLFGDFNENNTYSNAGTASRYFFNGDYTLEKLEQADPLFYGTKASRKERDAGLDSEERYTWDRTSVSRNFERMGSSDSEPMKNFHPTVKSLSISKHLATLLLPPAEYTPRMLFNPFSGSGSEAIGAIQAGWDCVIGVEKEHEYLEIAGKRVAYWEGKLRETLF